MPETPKKVFISSDHRGFELKSRFLKEFPDFSDLGPFEYNPEDDYNDSAVKVVKEVLKNPDSFGVLICGSAIGVSIQANRFKKIRAAIVSDPESAKTSREHNNANIICLSADTLSKNPEALKNLLLTLKTFLETPFSAEPRHSRRIKKLDLDYNLEEN